MVVAIIGSVAVWVSDSNPRTPKAWVKVLFDNAEPIAIAAATAVFLLESPDRRKAEQYEAWQVINSAMGQTGSGGRIQALEDLNKDGVALEGVAVPRADLSGIDLSYGNLIRTNFKKAKLNSANLQEAYLVFANLQGAELLCADLQGANLQGADLSRAYLHDANLEGAILWFADLQEAELLCADLQGADLSRADLQGADLQEANLQGACLGGANLSGAKNLTQDQLTPAKLCRTTLPQGIALDANRDCQELGIAPETGERISP